MAKKTVNTQAMNAAATEFGNGVVDAQGIKTHIMSAANDLSRAWTGQTANTFRSVMDGLGNRQQVLINDLETLRAAMVKGAHQYDEGSAANQGLVTNLGNSVGGGEFGSGSSGSGGHITNTLAGNK
ncbi:WXG100 family type VII secretion target [Streptomyces sp. NPDC000410]|uniref:WXG100 family type VII secretion target n=1 Tax=Streptomyces sp. NPDC000410 TaxID=3154254 RepID=UPI003333A479